MDFKDKVVFVTGAARGIGKEITRVFLERGAKVAVCDVDVKEGTKTAQKFKEEFGEDRVFFIKCDVTKDENFEAAYSECERQFNGLDILVNNAGIHHKELKNMEAVNFEGPIRGTELAIKKMGKHNGGKGGIVVNIASITGLLPFIIYPYYASIKAGLIHFCRIIGGKFHYGYHGVSVLCLCPGGVNTKIDGGEDTRKSSIYNKFVEEVIPELMSKITIMEPKEVGEAVIKLVNDNKSGEVAVIDKVTGFIYVPPSLENKILGLQDY